MASSMRRLAKDQAAVRRKPPPNYLFPVSDEDSPSLPDDLTQLVILLTGPEGTPYHNGLWQLQLKMPAEYPKSPPTATFRTRIFHPNIREETGEVCLETLKRDWDPKLTLVDILITISCLLIHPNPDSALNENAGALLQEDYEAFARQARLMSRVHAGIPAALREACKDARSRGEDTTSTRDFAREVMEDAKENEPKAETANERDKPVSGRCAKRALTELPVAGDGSTEDPSEVEQPRRKSPKSDHEPRLGSSCNPEDQDGRCDKGDRKLASQVGVACTDHKKVMWRATMGRDPTRPRTTTRTGIRRL